MAKFVFKHTLIFKKFWPYFTFLLITQNCFTAKSLISWRWVTYAWAGIPARRVQRVKSLTTNQTNSLYDFMLAVTLMQSWSHYVLGVASFLLVACIYALLIELYAHILIKRPVKCTLMSLQTWNHNSIALCILCKLVSKKNVKCQ